MEKEKFYEHKYPSISIQHYISQCNSYDEFEKVFTDDLINEDNRIGHYLQQLLWKYDKKASILSVEAMQSHSYVGKIINGQNNNPTRNVILCICLALGATLEETQYLLKYSGHAPLYVRKKRDVIVWFGLTKNESLDTVNDNLINRGLTPLYNKDK